MTYPVTPGMSFPAHIAALASQFLADFQRRDAAACASAYAEDAVKYNPGGLCLTGRTGIEQDWTRLFAETGFMMTSITPLDCRADGAVGYAVLRIETGAEAFIVMLGLRREGDDRWLITHEVIGT